MEEKKFTKISLSIFFLILAIIAIIVIGIFIYKIYNGKTIELQAQVNSSNETVSDLQGKTNSISETFNSNGLIENTTTSNTSNNNSTTFTDEQVKTTLSNYLELLAHANCDTLLENLTEKGKLNYNPSKDTILNDESVITTIKFSDYKNAMLNYVSESEFEKNWTSAQYFSENSNGYLTKFQGGGGLRLYTINSITKTDNLTYSAKTTSIVEDFVQTDDTMKEDENFTFVVKSHNGNCVIDSIKQID